MPEATLAEPTDAPDQPTPGARTPPRGVVVPDAPIEGIKRGPDATPAGEEPGDGPREGRRIAEPPTPPIGIDAARSACARCAAATACAAPALPTELYRMLTAVVPITGAVSPGCALNLQGIPFAQVLQQYGCPS